MDDIEFTIALETFLANAGIEIEGDMDEKMKVVLANGELGVEFAQYLYRALTLVEAELKAIDQKNADVFDFLDRHLRSKKTS